MSDIGLQLELVTTTEANCKLSDEDSRRLAQRLQPEPLKKAQLEHSWLLPNWLKCRFKLRLNALRSIYLYESRESQSLF